MCKFLKVIRPFFVMEPGDTFELSQDEQSYISKYSEQHSENNDANNSVTSKYQSEYTISIDFANALIKEGFLEEYTPPVTSYSNDKFINVFDEIDDLLKDYTDELKNLDDDMANMPACLKVEKQTVLTNLINMLNYLKSLKK